jgi:hypothetical protein
MTHNIQYNAVENRLLSSATTSDACVKADSEYKSLYIILLIGIFPSFAANWFCVSYFSSIFTISTCISTA